MNIISYISSLFGENKCFGCQRSGHFFCPQCSKILELYRPYCYVCKKYSQDFHVHKQCYASFPIKQTVVLTRYRNMGIKKLLRHAKYYGKHLAYYDIIIYHRDFFKKYIDSENSVFVPVPMHFFRKWKRGYNQSDKIVRSLSKICGIPVENNFIKRLKYTKQQSHLSQADRAKNLSRVFSLNNRGSIDANTIIYLVDDVISTGSTVLEITKLLHKNGYKNVRVVCLASD